MISHIHFKPISGIVLIRTMTPYYISGATHYNKNLLGHFDKVEEVIEINRYRRHHIAYIVDVMHSKSKIATRCRAFHVEFLPKFRQQRF